MAKNNDKTAPTPPAEEPQDGIQPQEGAPESPIKEESKPKKLDETIPGGRYLVDGVWVDANGKRLEKQQ